MSRLQQGEPGRRTKLTVLGSHPSEQDVVDVPVIGGPPAQQCEVVELVRFDHRDQRLRQVVVDVCVHTEQNVSQWRQLRPVPGRGRSAIADT